MEVRLCSSCVGGAERRKKGNYSAFLLFFMSLRERSWWRKQEHVIRVPFVSTVDNIADFFTKPLKSRDFFRMRDIIMNVPARARANSASERAPRRYDGRSEATGGR